MAPAEGIYTLLCERCGYVVQDLPTGAACPECGLPINESMPDRRTGTYWQQNPKGMAFCVNALRVVRHPRQTLDHMKPSTATNRSLQFMYAYSASWLVVYGTFAILAHRPDLDDHWETQRLWWLAYILSSAFAFLLSFPLAWALMCFARFEAFGLAFANSRRGGRVDRQLAAEVCAHASAGWFLGALGFAMIGVAASLVFAATGLGVVMNLGSSLAVGMLVGGVLFYEVFAIIGVRRCRFANRARPEED